MITNETLEQWLQDAKKATQGEWIQYNQKMLEATEKDIVVIAKSDSNHISNMSPANAIAVLEELKLHRLKYRTMEEYAEIEAAE